MIQLIRLQRSRYAYVAYWRKKSETIPQTGIRQILDAALERAPDQAKAHCGRHCPWKEWPEVPWVGRSRGTGTCRSRRPISGINPPGGADCLWITLSDAKASQSAEHRVQHEHRTLDLPVTVSDAWPRPSTIGSAGLANTSIYDPAGHARFRHVLSLKII
jgi:hypothetical protein